MYFAKQKFTAWYIRSISKVISVGEGSIKSWGKGVFVKCVRFYGNHAFLTIWHIFPIDCIIYYERKAFPFFGKLQRVKVSYTCKMQAKYLQNPIINFLKIQMASKGKKIFSEQDTVKYMWVSLEILYISYMKLTLAAVKHIIHIS